MNDVGDSINDELDLDRWLEEQSQEARQVREDADEAVWYVLQTYGDPVADEVRTAAVENLIDAHHAARNAGETTMYSPTSACPLGTLSTQRSQSHVRWRCRTSLCVLAPASKASGLPELVGQQEIRRARAPGRSDDPEPPLGRTGRLPGGSR